MPAVAMTHQHQDTEIACSYNSTGESENNSNYSTAVSMQQAGHTVIIIQYQQRQYFFKKQQ
jgi:hypothetical protein